MQKWAYYNDNDPRLCQWVKNLIKARILPDGEVDERPIQEVQPEDIRGFIQHHFFCGIGVWAYALRQAGWPDDRSVLTCSCPCQPFSSAGKKDGTADARHLWPEMFRIIREHRPPVVMGEQVASKHALAWLDLVLSDLEGAGYSAGAVDMCAAGVGAPHIRQRLWFVAENEGATWMRTKRWDYAGIDTGRGRETGVVADSECGAAERQRLKLAGAEIGDQGEARKWQRLRDDLGDGGDPGLLEHAAGPVNGFWADAEWLPCRDGKARPVEPKFIKMASGASGGMGPVCSEARQKERTKIDADTPKDRSDKGLCKLQGTTDTEAFSKRSPGRPNRIPSQNILQPGMHGDCLRGTDQGSNSTQQSKAVGQNGEIKLRNLWTNRPASCPPRGWEPDEQRVGELADFVRLLPSSIALAKLHGDTETAEAMLTLLKTCGAERLVQYPPDQVQEVWRSFSQEIQDRIRMGFESGSFMRTYESPLAHGAPARVLRLRAYGNAICAPVAVEAIRAYMESRAED